MSGHVWRHTHKQCVIYDPTLSPYRPLLLVLNQYAVRIRYPGLTTTVAEADDALKTLRRLRPVLRRKLGL
jgi:hypothetical protein